MRTFFLWVSLGLVVANAGATEIWATDSGSLVRFDSATPGTITVVGATGVGAMQAIDFSADGTLYGATNTDLYTLNTTTGQATHIGVSGYLGQDVPLDMSWDPATRQMYVVGGIDANSPIHLYTLNLATGAATSLGALDLPAPAAPTGMATNAAGVRYLHDSSHAGMYRLTGLHGDFMGAEGVSGGIFDGMTIDWSRDGTWYHALWDTDTARSELWTVNEATGVGTFVGVLGGGTVLVGDIAIQPVPEPAAVLLALIGVVALRRR